MVIEIPPNPNFKGGPFREGAGKCDGERDPLADEFDRIFSFEPVEPAPDPPLPPDEYDLDGELP